MTRPLSALWVVLGAAIMAIVPSCPAAAQNTFGPGPLSLPQSASDVVLLDVNVVMKGTTGDEAKDANLIAAARAAAAFGPGDRYNQILADGAALRMLHPDTLTGRPGRPEDVANAMLWLASPAGSWVSGQTINVHGGGHVLRLFGH